MASQYGQLVESDGKPQALQAKGDQILQVRKHPPATLHMQNQRMASAPIA